MKNLLIILFKHFKRSNIIYYFVYLVSFDNGAGKEILRIVTKNTPKKGKNTF